MSVSRPASFLSPTFLALWFGQLISLAGSALTNFAIGVWVFQRTGSVTQFALILMFSALPSVLVGPLVGVLVDRLDRRLVMLVSELCSGLAVLSMVLLLWAGQLQLWHICLVIGISSICMAFQWPAYAAVTTLLVPRAQLGRANGMIELGQGISQISAPALAGLLLALLSIEWVLVLDVLSFGFAVLTLLVVRVPSPPPTAGQGSSFREDLAYGWRYLRARHGLLGLLAFFAFGNYCATLVQVLLTPLALSVMSAQVLGAVMSVAGVGMLLGSVTMSVWGGGRRHILSILLFALIQSLSLLFAGLPPGPLLLGAIAFIYMFCIPIVLSSSQSIWQRKVAVDVQGRVFATRRMLATAIVPLAYLSAGPLADRVFEPLMAADGALAGSVGALIGSGDGRGVALLFMLLGALQALSVALAYSYPRLRNVEQELPDAEVVAVPQVPSHGEVVGV